MASALAAPSTPASWTTHWEIPALDSGPSPPESPRGRASSALPILWRRLGKEAMKLPHPRFHVSTRHQQVREEIKVKASLAEDRQKLETPSTGTPLISHDSEDSPESLLGSNDSPPESPLPLRSASEVDKWLPSPFSPNPECQSHFQAHLYSVDGALGHDGAPGAPPEPEAKPAWAEEERLWAYRMSPQGSIQSRGSSPAAKGLATPPHHALQENQQLLDLLADVDTVELQPEFMKEDEWQESSLQVCTKGRYVPATPLRQAGRALGEASLHAVTVLGSHASFLSPAQLTAASTESQSKGNPGYPRVDLSAPSTNTSRATTSSEAANARACISAKVTEGEKTFGNQEGTSSTRLQVRLEALKEKTRQAANVMAEALWQTALVMGTHMPLMAPTPFVATSRASYAAFKPARGGEGQGTRSYWVMPGWQHKTLVEGTRQAGRLAGEAALCSANLLSGSLPFLSSKAALR